MSTLNDLVELELDDAELVPEILPAHARLSLTGPVQDLVVLFERAAAVCPSPGSEVVSGSAFALLEGVSASATSLPFARISASDGETTISVRGGDTRVLMPGSVLVPPKKILDVLKAAPEPTARIEIVGETATVRSGRAVWNIAVPTGDALSLLTAENNIHTVEVPVGPFLSALLIARRGASANNGRPALDQLEVRDGFITGCDGARIHRAWLDGVPEDLTLSIPVKVADELVKGLRATTSERFELGASDYTIVAHIGDDTIVAQRMLVPFPDNVNTLLLGPAMTNTDHLTVSRNDLLAVIKRVRINSDPDYLSIFLGIRPGRKDKAGQVEWTLNVSARDRVGNASQETLECSFTGAGKARELCFNHRYLADLLTSYPEDTITLRVGPDTKTQKHPLLVEDRTTGFSGLVQQMRADYL